MIITIIIVRTAMFQIIFFTNGVCGIKMIVCGTGIDRTCALVAVFAANAFVFFIGPQLFVFAVYFMGATDRVCIGEAGHAILVIGMISQFAAFSFAEVCLATVAVPIRF